MRYAPDAKNFIPDEHAAFKINERRCIPAPFFLINYPIIISWWYNFEALAFNLNLQ